MKFTLYRADRLGMPENCVYPHKVAVTDKNTLLQAVSYDYVCAEYRGNYLNSSERIVSRSTATTTTAMIRRNGSIPPMLPPHFPAWPLRFTTAATT